MPVETTIELKTAGTKSKSKKAPVAATPAANIETFKTFKVETKIDKEGHIDKFVIITGNKLKVFLRDNVNIESAFDTTPVIPSYELFNVIDQIRYRAERYEQQPLVEELIKFLESENASVLEKLANLLDKGVMSFGLMKTLFSPNTEILITGDELSAGKVINADYKRSWMGTKLIITYEYITSNGREFFKVRNNVAVAPWEGMKELSKLPIRKIDSETKAALTERGRVYATIGTGSHYLDYTGNMGVKSWWSWSAMRANGRIMTDIVTYGQFASKDDACDYDEGGYSELSEDTLWITDPYILGFSFATKQWGRFSVGQISEIKFRTDAFDQLVLSQDKKDLIRALVTNGTSGFSDIISGKGGGCIFLLHGEPGVGKTLTAEAISELLQRPLYSVSVGELGVSPADLEKNLRQILDVAQIWNAVVLIDEADIFLEKRTSGDILRNAMVGIFLRLLEYHQGVMFLTTNRVTEFDVAFHSRISIALKYGKLTQEARESIWTNLLEAANITGLQPSVLSQSEINGRQIKTTIRLAQGLAKQQGVPVSASHIQATLAVSQQFQQDLKEV